MRPLHTFAAASVAVLSLLLALHGCGGARVCNPACTGAATCVDGQCVATCNPSQCGYDGTCVDGGCARAHPGVECPAPTLVAGGLVGPASPPSGCVQSVQPTAWTAAQVQELGTFPVGRTITFNVPANSSSFNIVSQAVSAAGPINYKGIQVDNSVVPDLVRDPSGALWFNDTAAVPSDLETVLVEYAGDSPIANFFTVPNTERSLTALRAGGVPSGTWQLRVNDYSYECLTISGCDGGTDAGNYDIKVLTRPGPAISEGKLDLGIYLVETSGLDSGTALTDPHVQRWVQSTTTLFAQQGICPGTITFYDVPSWATTRYANGINADNSGPCDALSQMFTLSRSDSRLNLFWVSSISGGGQGTVLGIDGTIPGPSTVGGTVHSGAAVSISDLSTGSCGYILSPLTCGADEVAYIAAHEAGHWLGLFHPTEATGTYWDPLADTPKCICNQCVSATQAAKCGNAQDPTLVLSSSCGNVKPGCGGADNLMFWVLGGSTGGKLTPEQGEVMRANLAVH